MSKRIVLHVGTPKTGTSQIQNLLLHNAGSLAAKGVLYPALRHDAHFLAALDLMRLPWGGLEADAVGRWDALARDVRAWPGTSIISHEILATATAEQAQRAIDSLGKAEVHLVLSVRDLARQIPAEWQENVKHRSTLTYSSFLERIQDPQRSTRVGAWFWGAQEIPAILERWGASLDPAHVHLVTVPVSGSGHDVLQDRFLQAFGLANHTLKPTESRANPSLGSPETALLRRVNKQVNPVLAPAEYRPLVRELLAHQTLSQRTSSPRLALPPDLHDWVSDLTAAWSAEISARGYDVVGDLKDLLPQPPVMEYADPDRPKEAAVAWAGVDAIKALLVENGRLLEQIERLHQDVGDAHAARERAQLRPSFKVRQRLVRASENSRLGGLLMKVYRKARSR